MIVNVISKSLVLLIALIIVLSMLFGSSISKAEFLSPNRTAAETRQINIQNDLQEQLNRLDLKKKEAQTKEEIDRINLEMEKARIISRLEMERLARRNQLEAELLANLYFLIPILVGVLALALTLVLSYLLLRIGLAKIPAHSVSRDLWGNPDYRMQKRREAQLFEKKLRSQIPLQNNGFHKTTQDIPITHSSTYKEHDEQWITKRPAN